jgi:cytidylate kinase
MFRVITVEREFGSGGAMIAKKAAEQLGWILLDKSLVRQIAREIQVDVETARRYDEQVDSWWHRINCSGLWAAAIEAGAAPRDVHFIDAESTAWAAQEVIAADAHDGNCVIVGRGAQCVLQGDHEVFHVFVYAPLAQRVARIQERLGTDKNIEELIQLTDHTRAAYIRKYFGCDWRDPHLYQMMISSELGEDTVAGLIIRAVESVVSPASSRLCHRIDIG